MINWANTKRLQDAIIPSFQSPRDIYEEKFTSCVHRETVWLDLGCGHRLLSEWRYKEEIELVKKGKLVVGLDYNLSSLKKHRSIEFKLRGDVASLPFQDSVFDLVTSNMVLEHLEHPDVFFHDVYRVLKTGGTFIIHTPNAFGYPTIVSRLIPEKHKKKIISKFQDRVETDIFRAYYRANTQKKLVDLANRAVFHVVDFETAMSSPKFVKNSLMLYMELHIIKLFMTKHLRRYRTNIIVVLKK